MEIQVKSTLEQLLQSWNPKLWIRELEIPDVDSVMFGDQHVCCVPKGGKWKCWYDIMSDAVRKEGNVTHDGIPHRAMTGLVQTLIKKKIIDWDTPRRLRENYLHLSKAVNPK